MLWKFSTGLQEKSQIEETFQRRIHIKIIFLDIDGVLNYAHCPYKLPDGWYFVDEKKIKLLKEIINATDAKIVLSSTWRVGWFDLEHNMHTTDAENFIRLRDKLREFNIEFLSRTPVTGRTRGKEITQWIQNWNGEVIESFVILDDLPETELTPYAENLVQTSFSRGLLRRHVNKAIRILNKKYNLERDDSK